MVGLSFARGGFTSELLLSTSFVVFRSFLRGSAFSGMAAMHENRADDIMSDSFMAGGLMVHKHFSFSGLFCEEPKISFFCLVSDWCSNSFVYGFPRIQIPAPFCPILYCWLDFLGNHSRSFAHAFSGKVFSVSQKLSVLNLHCFPPSFLLASLPISFTSSQELPWPSQSSPLLST